MRVIQRVFRRRRFVLTLLNGCLLSMVVLVGGEAVAQVSVLTAHNDIARTGQNLNETILTPASVNPNQFGKLFSEQLYGLVHAQPLYVSQVAIPGKGTHNVVYVATDLGMVYAFDADTNGGSNANPLWQTNLTASATPPAGSDQVTGVIGTPVIDLSSQTIYLASVESQGANFIFQLHALDITTGAEKLGGPVPIQASIPGTGSGSVGGILAFDPNYQFQRPGLLLLNGVVYIAFGAIYDQATWHGWIFSYNAATLKQIDVFCTSANGSGGAIWMSEAGLAAEVNDLAKPYGRMFVATANGSYGIASPTVTGKPYSNPLNEYGMSVLDLDLTNGQMTVEDEFTPYDEALLDGQDGDLGSGGPVLLPTQAIASGKTLNPLVQIGKSGMIYILDRNNLGGFNTAGDQIVQEVQTPITEGYNWGAGVWGSEAYWNNNIYSGGTNPALHGGSYQGTGNSFTAYSFVDGVLSTAPTSQSNELFVYPGPTPSVSANGTTNGILWVLNNQNATVRGNEVLLAYDATNLANTLYSSNDNLARDNPGIGVEFNVPTIANGKVYVGAWFELSVYGLLGAAPTAPAPTFSPSSGTSFTGTQTVTITDAVPGATIYYTTNGSTPTSNSPIYGKPLMISSDETITAIASPNGYLQSAPASATYTLTTAAADPVFSLAGGTYSGTQTLTITDSSKGAIIYYTLDGSMPTSASAVYGPAPLPISVSETVQAIAIAPGLTASLVVSATYTIQPVYTIDFSQGFTLAQGPMQFNGSTDLDDIRLQLTNGGLDEASSAFYATRVNIQSFTTDFTFQLSNPAADGVTFTIQNVGPTALGGGGGYLGYGLIPKSVAIKFDLYNNDGEGSNSTGLYLNGAAPTVPAINLTGTGINLHSGDFMDAHITYNGTDLTMSLTDAVTLASWSTSWPINIPAIVGGDTAYVGFTGGTGGLSSSQKFTYWTYIAGPPSVPNYPAGFDAPGLTLNGGATLNGTTLRLTDGNSGEARSAFFTSPVAIQQFSTSFSFQLTNANADGFTFAIQGIGPTALGGGGGYLGYGLIPKSMAIKFDLFNNDGEGPNSTGLYLNGAAPTVPAINLTGTGINLHSGDTFNAQLTYNGTTLTVVIADTVTNASTTQNYTVNIPSIVDGPTAYVGFTAGTGGLAAIQNILNWTFTPSAIN